METVINSGGAPNKPSIAKLPATTNSLLRFNLRGLLLPGKLLAGQGGIFHGGAKGKDLSAGMVSVLLHFATPFCFDAC